MIALIVAVCALIVLAWMLVDIAEPVGVDAKQGNQRLFVYCAAGTRPAIEAIVNQYSDEFGVRIEIQYQGSNTLLSQIEVARSGDIYIAADQSYIDKAIERGLVQESMSIARQRPVIAIPKQNPKGIRTIDDLLRSDVTVCLGNPDQAAVGKITRRLLTASGQWDALAARVRADGVFKPTVPEAANAVKLGSVDAAILWDATLVNYPDLTGLRVPELDAGTADIMVGVLTSSEAPTRALHFARYLAAPEKGQQILEAKGFETVPGDPWSETPELTFFCGAVNRAAVEPAIDAFQKREGVRINVNYNGCGLLTGQMRTIRDQSTDSGFPDTYMACDVYYLDVVKDWFQDAVNVSDTRVVIAVPKGNPRGISSLQDLAQPDIRVAVGQPKQCTIGVITRRILDAAGLTDSVNIVMETTSSALLIPAVANKTVDAALAYATDSQAESDRVDAIVIDVPEALAVQPFSIARSSPNKQLAKRLFLAIARSQKDFESAGFHWRLDGAAESSE